MIHVRGGVDNTDIKETYLLIIGVCQLLLFSLFLCEEKANYQVVSGFFPYLACI
jgi:hypothetical protein